MVIVLNRKSLENFELELVAEEDVEITTEYVILQGTRQQTATVPEDGEALEAEQEQQRLIYGLWIFAEPPPSSTAHMREVNAKLIQDCAARAEASRKATMARDSGQDNGHAARLSTTMRNALAGIDGELAAERMSRGSSTAGRQGLDFGRQEAQHWWQPAEMQHGGQSSGVLGGSDGALDQSTASAGGDVLGDLFRRARHAQRSEAAG